MENNLPQNNISPVKLSFWVANPRLKTLLLVLIIIFLISGVGLAVLAQWQASYRQKIYEQTQNSLPKHQNSKN